MFTSFSSWYYYKRLFRYSRDNVLIMSMSHHLPTAMTLPSMLVMGLLLLCSTKDHSVVASSIDNVNPDSLAWKARAEFPGRGLHHPITFANTTHGFVLSGTTNGASYTSDLWVYEAETDRWTDVSATGSAFPGEPRSFGYGVASTLDCSNSKAYLGFGAGENSKRFSDWWEFDMTTHNWKQLMDFPGEGRRHPAINFLESLGEIHVGLGDGNGGNYNDYWSYNIENDEWQQLDDFPSTERHHPFYFAIDTDSYVGLGHSSSADTWIERDWYRYDGIEKSWLRQEDFSSYALDKTRADVPGIATNPFPVTTEGRVAGTQFSVAGSCASEKTLGFVLSGDGDDHRTMETGEFHVFDPTESSIWHSLPPHPGVSRWAPGSFVLQGSSQVYLLGGYDRQQRILLSDVWAIDLSSLFDEDNILINNESVDSFDESPPEFDENEEESVSGFFDELPAELDVNNEEKVSELNKAESSAVASKNLRDHTSLVLTISSIAFLLQMH